MPSSWAGRFVICFVVLFGFVLGGNGLLHFHPSSTLPLLSAALVSCAASRMKVKLPGITGTMSINLPFILIAVAAMGQPEAVIIGCASAFVQCLPRSLAAFRPVRLVFNTANMASAVTVASLIYNAAPLRNLVASRPLLLAIAGLGFFLVNTIPVALIIGFTERKNAVLAWLEMTRLSLPYYVASAGVAGLTFSLAPNLLVALAILLLMAAVLYSYRVYFAALSPRTEPVIESSTRANTARAV